MSEFIVVQCHAYMNQDGYGTEYTSDMKPFDTLEKTIQHGYVLTASDDFLVALINKGIVIQTYSASTGLPRNFPHERRRMNQDLGLTDEE